MTPTPQFDARNARGPINNATGPINQIFGDTYNIFGGALEEKLKQLGMLTPEALEQLKQFTTRPAGKPLELLVALLQGQLQEQEALLKAYRASVEGGPKWGVSSSELPALIIEIVQKLNTRRGPNGIPWVVEFAEWLSFYTNDAQLSSELKDWVDTTMNEWRLDRNTIQQLRESIAERDPARAGPPSLLVALTPDDQEPSFYRVQAWLWRSKEFIRCIHKDHSDSELYDDKKLGTLLTTLIGQIKTDIADQEPELRIEFFLRIDRLAYPVEKVEIGREYTILGKKRVELWPIAIKYNVVVRSLERIQRDVEGWQELITSWEHKWSMTKNMLRTISAQPAALEYSGSENDLDGEETSMLKLSHADNYESSFLQSRLIMPRTIGFALLEPPGSDNDLRAALEEALIMGIPLGIWLRSGANCPLPSHPDFTALVASKHLGELPKLVTDTRRLGASDPSRPGGSLVFFWDDYDRLPFDPTHDSQYTALTQQGEPL